VIRAVVIGLMVAAALLLLTGGHVLFLPLPLIPVGGLAWRSKPRASRPHRSRAPASTSAHLLDKATRARRSFESLPPQLVVDSPLQTPHFY
jgi:hypothetical protein